MVVVDKYESARAILNEHNAVLGDSHPAIVDVAKTIDNIKSMGGTTDDALKQLRYEDIVECISIGGTNWPKPDSIKPILLAKRLATAFRGKEEEPKSHLTNQLLSDVPGSLPKVNVGMLTLEQLISAYDPADSDGKIGTRLRKESKGKPFIVFKSGRIVDVPTSVMLLKELKDGYEPRANVLVGSQVFDIHPVGFIPNNFAEENPIYVGRPLRPGDTCDQLNRSWAGVSTEVRQFIRILLDYEVPKGQTLTLDKAHTLLDRAINTTLADLMVRYGNAAVAFQKLSDQGKLPRLKVELNNQSSRPFDGGVKVSAIR